MAFTHPMIRKSMGRRQSSWRNLGGVHARPVPQHHDRVLEHQKNAVTHNVDGQQWFDMSRNNLLAQAQEAGPTRQALNEACACQTDRMLCPALDWALAPSILRKAKSFKGKTSTHSPPQRTGRKPLNGWKAQPRFSTLAPLKGAGHHRPRNRQRRASAPHHQPCQRRRRQCAHPQEQLRHTRQAAIRQRDS